MRISRPHRAKTTKPRYVLPCHVMDGDSASRLRPRSGRKPPSTDQCAAAGWGPRPGESSPPTRPPGHHSARPRCGAEATAASGDPAGARATAREAAGEAARAPAGRGTGGSPPIPGALQPDFAVAAPQAATSRCCKRCRTPRRDLFHMSPARYASFIAATGLFPLWPTGMSIPCTKYSKRLPMVCITALFEQSFCEKL